MAGCYKNQAARTWHMCNLGSGWQNGSRMAEMWRMLRILWVSCFCETKRCKYKSWKTSSACSDLHTPRIFWKMMHRHECRTQNVLASSLEMHSEVRNSEGGLIISNNVNKRHWLCLITFYPQDYHKTSILFLPWMLNKSGNKSGCRSRIAFKLVWAPPDFNSFVLVDDSHWTQPLKFTNSKIDGV